MGVLERFYWETYYLHSAVSFYKHKLLPELLRVHEATLRPLPAMEAPPFTPAAADPLAPLTPPQGPETITSPSAKVGKRVLVHSSGKVRVIHKLFDNGDAVLCDVGAPAPERARPISSSAFSVVPVDNPVNPSRHGQRVVINMTARGCHSLIGKAATVVTFNHNFCELMPDDGPKKVKLKTQHLHALDAQPEEGPQAVTVKASPEEFRDFFRNRMDQNLFDVKDYSKEYLHAWMEHFINEPKRQKL